MSAPVAACAVNFRFDRKMKEDNDPWWQFNNSFQNVEAHSPAEFEEWVNAGHSYCARHAHVHHQKANGRQSAYRCIENWQPTSILVLDFDRGDVDLANLKADPIAGPHLYYAHATVSWAPEFPRVRAIFVRAKGTINRLEKYRLILAALAHKFATADRMSKNPVMAFAGNKARPLHSVSPGKLLDDTTILTLIEEYEEAQRAEQQQRADMLRIYKTESPQAEEIAAALHFVPSQMEYMDWLRILLAIHSAFPGEEGIQIAEAWSPGKPGEIAGKWRSFGNREGGTTVNTLFWMARRHGYAGPRKLVPTTYWRTALNKPVPRYGSRN